MALVPSAQYPSQIDTDPAYPQGKARNAGTFQDGTGTPLEKSWVNDLWGFQQALLDDAEITPSGTPDAVGASDYLDAVKAIAVRVVKLALDPVLMRLRQINIPNPFTDEDECMAALRQSNGPIMVLKSGTDDAQTLSDHDDLALPRGTVASITSLVTGLANNGSRMVAIGTGGNRCCFTVDFGENWAAGSDLGATPERIIYNSTHSRFMVTYAAGVDVAQDVDAASTWAVVSSGLTTAQGGIAHFSNGDTVVCGYDGGSAVEMALSSDGGGSWAAAATVPNPGDYADSGTIEGSGGTYIYHAGRTTAGNQIRICRTDDTMTWELLATLPAFGSILFKPRMLVCPQTGVLVVLYRLSGGVVGQVSRDGGATWSDRMFYRSRFTNAFALASGRLFSTFDDALFATDRLD